MKRILYILVTAVTIGSLLFSCEPVEDRESLPAVSLTSDAVKYSIVQSPTNEHEIVVTSNNPEAISYWSYFDSKGNALGHSNKSNDIIALPFAGTFTIHYTAYTRGGAVETTPVQVTISENDDNYFRDERWGRLTNGAEGKTWVLNMIQPLEFVDSKYENSTISAPGWWPLLTDIPWANLEDKNWGEVTFDLNGGYNVTVTQTNPTVGSAEQTTKTGTFNYTLTKEFKEDKIAFNGGVEMLHPNEASYFSSSFSFTNVRIVELTETTLSYIAIRADGGYLVYHLIAKQ
ncbi:hypothetical protein [Flavobacterium hercynium]|nr:hypothetical protein [Flavobacterium hercynium]SMP09460.1 hypothetical protein SAMN06265346_102261 [Flavobacterium hercynium]